jgi:hypothetical protein
MLIASDSFVQAFVELLYTQPESLIIYSVFFYLNLDLKLSMILDPSFTNQIFKTPQEISQYSRSIIGAENAFTRLVGQSNVVLFFQQTSEILLGVILFLVFAFLVAIAVYFFWPKTNKDFSKNKGNTEMKARSWLLVISVVLNYYEYFFLVIAILFMKSVVCVTSGTGERIGLGENSFLEAEREIKAQVYTIEYTSSLLNPAVTCRSLSHIYLLIVLGLSFVMSAYYRIIYHYLQVTIPNPKYFLSKYGAIDNIHTIFLICIFFYRNYLGIFDAASLENNLPYFYLTCTILMAADVVIQTISSPFYILRANIFRLFESITISLTSFFAFLTLTFGKSSTSSLLFKEYPSIIVLTALILVVHRISTNISVSFIDKENMKPFTEASNKRMMSFAHKAMQYVEESLHSKSDSIESKEFQQMLMDFMTLVKTRSNLKIMNMKRAARDHESSIKLLNSKLMNNLYSRVTKLEPLGDVKLQEDYLEIAPVKDPKEGENQPSRSSVNLPDIQKSEEIEEDIEKDKQKVHQLQEGLSPIKRLNTGLLKNAVKKLTKDKDLGDSNFNFEMDANSGKNFSDFGQEAPSFGDLNAFMNPNDNPSNNLSRISRINSPRDSQVEKPNDLIDVHSESISASEAEDKEISPGMQKLMKKGSVHSGASDHLNQMKEDAKNIKAKGSFRTTSYVREKRERLENRARYFLLNMIEEARLNGVKFPIHLMNDLLEEHLAKLLLDPNTPFGKLSEILLIFVFFKLNFLGAIYSISIQIRELEQTYSLISKARKVEQNTLFFKIIYAMISRHIGHNLETGLLLFPKTTHLLTFEKDQSTSVRLFACATFINVYSDLKSMVSKICNLKSKFFSDIHNNGVDFKVIFAQAKQFSLYSAKLMEDFKSLIEQSKGKFTPLMMIYGNFLYHFEQNKTAARKILQTFSNKVFFFDLRSITGMNLGPNEELITVGVSMEKEKFHKMIMVSCNCFNYLEYDAFELIGKNLNLVLPDPINSFHTDLMDPKRLTGILFDMKAPQQMVIKKKTGYMATCKAVTRMNYRVSSSLEVFAALIFNRDTFDQERIMVVNEEMMITEISEIATDIFEKNTYIYQYNNKFTPIFADLNYVSNFRLRNESLELSNIMKDKVILQHYDTYFNFMNGEIIDVVDKSGFERTLRLKINVTYMPTIQRFMRLIYFTITDLEADFEPEILNNQELNVSGQQEEFNQYSKDFRQKRRKFNYGMLDKNELELKRLLEYVGRSSLMATKSKKSLSKGKDSMMFSIKENTISANDSAINSPVLSIKDQKDSPSAFVLQSMVPEFQPQFSRRSRSSSKENRFSTSSAVKDQDELEMIARARMAAKKTRSSKDTSSLAKGLRKDYMEQKYIKIIEDKITSLWYNVLFLLLVTLFVAAIIVQAIVGYSKYGTFGRLQGDIENRLITVDQSSQALSAAINLAMYIDLEQAVQDGKIGDGIFSSFGVPSILKDCQEKSQSVKGKMLYYSKKVDLNMINVSYDNIIDLGYFTYDHNISSYFLNSSQSANSNNIFWYKSGWGAKKFIQYMQPYVDKYIEVVQISGLTESAKVLKDYLSLALSESILGYLYSIAEAVKSYFRGESEMSYNNILTAQLSSIVSMTAVVVIVVVYCVALQLKMHWLYKLIFNFKVNSE